MRRAIGREEDELCLTDQILVGDIADRRQDAAVLRVVAVVAHREIMVGRHVIDRRVVERAVLTAAEAEFLDDAVLYGAAAGGARQALAITQLDDKGAGLLIDAGRGF